MIVGSSLANDSKLKLALLGRQPVSYFCFFHFLYVFMSILQFYLKLCRCRDRP